MNNLSAEGEFRYILTWFCEWSELQRDDFVPVIVEYLQSAQQPTVNGMTNSITNMHINADRPMSLFQCRIKLFREWAPKWPDFLKHKLKEKIIEIDTKVGEKIINEIKSHNTEHLNGNCNGSADENLLSPPSEENGICITAVEQQQSQPPLQQQQQQSNNAAVLETTVNVGADVDGSGSASDADPVETTAMLQPTVEVAVSNEMAAATAAEPAEPVQLQTSQHIYTVAATSVASTPADIHT